MKPRKWHPKYDRLAHQFAEKHFGGWDGVIKLFASDKPLSLKWSDISTDPVDVAFVKKMANEYHGLERHAHQYHVCAMYDYSYHHWLMAAVWRKENMDINNFTDEKHRMAIDFDLGCAAYNLALYDWFVQRRSFRKTMPQPYHFGLKGKVIDNKDIKAEKELTKIYNAVSA